MSIILEILDFGTFRFQLLRSIKSNIRLIIIQELLNILLINTILVVDDVVSNVLLLKVLLTNEKFKVVTANNGKDALVQAAEKQPDLILLDVMMPEMNGFEVSEKLKANPVTQNSYYFSDCFEHDFRYRERVQGGSERFYFKAFQ